MNFQQTHFETFQLPQTFAIDLKVLATRYRELQKSVHPDKFATASAQEKRLSAQWTAQINEAFTTLNKPLPRAIYLLSLQELEIEHNPQLDPMFLMEQIELREELDEIETDDASLELLDVYKSKIEAILAGLEVKFDTSYPGDLKQAEQVVYELQFINKLLLSADKLEEKLLDY